MDTAVRQQIIDNGIEFVRLEMEDIHGIPRGFISDVDHFLDGYEKGVALCTSTTTLSVDGRRIMETGLNCETVNSYLYPDLSTFTVLPWMDKTASVFCDHRKEYGNINAPYFEFNTRGICNQQLKKLENMGYKLFSAFEYEFYVADKEFKSPIYNDINFAAVCLNKKSLPFVYDIMRNMKKVGIKPEIFVGEFGPAQHEITQTPTFGIKSSDNASRFKTITKDVCSNHNLSALFLTKPFKGVAGSSAHFNHSVWDINRNVNVFYDRDSEYNLSEIAKNWIAGLQEHARAIMCLACPTYNCYERCRPNSLTPMNNSWGLDNRTCTFRVKNHGPKTTYMENRMPGAAVNPYLLAAGCLIAGMDGIKRDLRLKHPPYKGEASLQDMVAEDKLPRTLSDALECLTEDKLFVQELGDTFLKAFSAMTQDEIKNAEEHKDKDLWKWYLDYYGDFI